MKCIQCNRPLLDTEPGLSCDNQNACQGRILDLEAKEMGFANDEVRQINGEIGFIEPRKEKK